MNFFYPKKFSADTVGDNFSFLSFEVKGVGVCGSHFWQKLVLGFCTVVSWLSTGWSKSDFPSKSGTGLITGSFMYRSISLRPWRLKRQTGHILACILACIHPISQLFIDALINFTRLSTVTDNLLRPAASMKRYYMNQLPRLQFVSIMHMTTFILKFCESVSKLPHLLLHCPTYVNILG